MNDASDISRDFGRLEGKLDGLVAIVMADRTAREGLENRITKVEHKLWWFTGIGAALAFFASKIGLNLGITPGG